MWDLSSRPGAEPVSSASQGGFLTTGPPGKSLELSLDSGTRDCLLSPQQLAVDVRGINITHSPSWSPFSASMPFAV